MEAFLTTNNQVKKVMIDPFTHDFFAKWAEHASLP
jgi:hypothetical protein